jgi:hypothetical protein
MAEDVRSYDRPSIELFWGLKTCSEAIGEWSQIIQNFSINAGLA